MSHVYVGDRRDTSMTFNDRMFYVEFGDRRSRHSNTSTTVNGKRYHGWFGTEETVLLDLGLKSLKHINLGRHTLIAKLGEILRTYKRKKIGVNDMKRAVKTDIKQNTKKIKAVSLSVLKLANLHTNE